jgi:hypothetical protein
VDAEDTYDFTGSHSQSVDTAGGVTQSSSLTNHVTGHWYELWDGYYVAYDTSYDTAIGTAEFAAEDARRVLVAWREGSVPQRRSSRNCCGARWLRCVRSSRWRCGSPAPMSTRYQLFASEHREPPLVVAYGLGVDSAGMLVGLEHRPGP